MGRVAPLFSLLSTLTLYLCLSTVIAHRGNRQHDAGLPLQGQGDSRLEPSGTLPQYYTQPSYAYDSPPPYVAVTSSFVSAPASSEYASSDDSMDQTTWSTATRGTGTDSALPLSNRSTTSSPSSITVTSDTTVPLGESSSTAPWMTTVAVSRENSQASGPESSTIQVETSTTPTDGHSLSSTQHTAEFASISTTPSPSSSESFSGDSSAARSTSSESSHVDSWTSLDTATPDTSAPPSPSSSLAAASTIRLTVTRVISVTDSVATSAETLLSQEASGSRTTLSSSSTSGSSTLPRSLSSLARSIVVSGTVLSGTQHGGPVSSTTTDTMAVASSSEWSSKTTESSMESFSTSILPNTSSLTLTKPLTLTGSEPPTTTTSSPWEDSGTLPTTGQMESGSSFSTVSPTSTFKTSIWRGSSWGTGTSASSLSSSSARFVTLTSTLVKTLPASPEQVEGATSATRSQDMSTWISSSVEAATGERTETAATQSPTDTVITLSITSRTVRSTQSILSASRASQGSASASIVPESTTASELPTGTLTSSLSQATGQPSSFVSTTSSSSETYTYSYTYTSPRSPFPTAPTPDSTALTDSRSGPQASATSGDTQGGGSTKRPITTGGPGSTTASGGGSKSASYGNTTSGSWMTRTVVSSFFGTVGDSQTSGDSLDTVVETLTLTIEPSTGLSSGSTPSMTSSWSRSGLSRSTASADATLSAHWTTGGSHVETRTVTFTPPASSGSALTASSGPEHGSTWAPGSKSARFPLSSNSTMSRPTMGGTAWTTGAPSTWSNSTRVEVRTLTRNSTMVEVRTLTRNSTMVEVRTLTRSIVLTPTQVPGSTTADRSESTLWNQATASTRPGSTEESTTTRLSGSTRVASGTISLTRVVLTKVTLTLRSGTTEILTTVTVGPTSAVGNGTWARSTATSSAARSGEGDGGGEPTDDGSSGGRKATRSDSWSTTCTEEAHLYSSSEGGQSTASCTAVVSGMTTTTWCAGGTVMGTNGVSSTTWTSPFSQPTRFETWVTKRESALESQELLHGGPRSERGSETPLPGNPNYPWGGDSPVHRHQNVTELSHGIMSGALEQSRRMSKVVGRLRAVLL